MAKNRGLLQVSAEQRQELDRWAQSRTLPSGDVFRARIVLALADGLSYREIERKLGASSATIALWKSRFEHFGVLRRLNKPNSEDRLPDSIHRHPRRQGRGAVR